MLKTIRKIALSGIFIALIISCDGVTTSSPDEGNWVEESDFEGATRSGAVAFVIGDLAYVGTGHDGDDRLRDFWQYDNTRNSWFRVADFPGRSRNAAVAFAVEGKGYVGTGYDGDEELKDFWEYDPGLNRWRQIDDLPGPARFGATSFVFNNQGYVGTGNDGDNNLKDFYRFNPDTGSWTQISSMGGSKRQGAFSFVIGNYAYAGGGIHNGTYEEDFWRYDPATDLWDRMNDLDDDDSGNILVLREYAAAFAIGDHAYISVGKRSSSIVDTWRYNPVEDEWDELTEFEGSAREQAISFVIGEFGFVCSGRNINERYDDIWSFRPLEEYDDED